jgi:hypothetical protein
VNSGDWLEAVLRPHTLAAEGLIHSIKALLRSGGDWLEAVSLRQVRYMGLS